MPGFVVVAKLGAGGMGDVYLALEPGLDRPVAVKVITKGAGAAGPSGEPGQGPAEGPWVARFNSRAIVSIHLQGRCGPGPDAGKAFLVFEHADGGSLARYLEEERTTPLDFQEAAQVVRVLAGAVSDLHQRSIIHRDLKPGNVLLVSRAASFPDVPGCTILRKVGVRETSVVFLAWNRRANRLALVEVITKDLGPPVAHGRCGPGPYEDRPFRVLECPDGTCLAHALTGPEGRGILLLKGEGGGLLDDYDLKVADFGLAAALGSAALPAGTPGYMAPEQGRGVKLRPTGDVYSLGVILLELLTWDPGRKRGRVPDTCPEPREVRRQLRERGVPAELREVCVRCLRREPERRYRTAGLLADHLDRFLRKFEEVRALVVTAAAATAAGVALWVALCWLVTVGGSTLLTRPFGMSPEEARPVSSPVSPHGGGQEPHGWGPVWWACLGFGPLPLALWLVQRPRRVGWSAFLRQRYPFLPGRAQAAAYVAFLGFTVAGAWVFYDAPLAGQVGFRAWLGASHTSSVGKELVLALLWSAALSLLPLVAGAAVRACFLGSWLRNLWLGLKSVALVVALVVLCVFLFLIFYGPNAHQDLRGALAGAASRVAVFLALADLVRSTEGPVGACLSQVTSRASFRLRNWPGVKH